MKKFFTVLLSSFLLAGCGIIGDKGVEGALTGETIPLDTSEQEDSSSEPETHEGEIGEKMSTMFFDFVVNDVYSTNTIGGTSPADGNKFIVTDITIKNTDDVEITMFSSDFYLYWGDGEEEYSLPRVYDDPDHLIMDGELEDEYDLGSGEEISGYLIYEVPEDTYAFLVSAEDIYTNSDGEEFYGDFYDVYAETE
ncbi:MAG: DUF4352 domain-containing protein [Solobacterium sp.]|nr:DUF4352 domain-containing protein [Solobacterium sp.]